MSTVSPQWNGGFGDSGAKHSAGSDKVQFHCLHNSDLSHPVQTTRSAALSGGIILECAPHVHKLYSCDKPVRSPLVYIYIYIM